jgi:hypothetical protein
MYVHRVSVCLRFPGMYVDVCRCMCMECRAFQAYEYMCVCICICIECRAFQAHEYMCSNRIHTHMQSHAQKNQRLRWFTSRRAFQACVCVCVCLFVCICMHTHVHVGAEIHTCKVTHKHIIVCACSLENKLFKHMHTHVAHIYICAFSQQEAPL